MVFLIGSTATADFCIDSPDGRVEALLLKRGGFGSNNSLIVEFLLYYLRGCPIDDFTQTIQDITNIRPDAQLASQLEAIQGELENVLNFLSTLNIVSEDEFLQACGARPGQLTQDGTFGGGLCYKCRCVAK